MSRVARGGAPLKADMARYAALRPQGALENDVQVVSACAVLYSQ